ncbi:hypothetical protein LPJ73_005465, partial [Coemansia sp. RSA 2703]
MSRRPTNNTNSFFDRQVQKQAQTQSQPEGIDPEHIPGSEDYPASTVSRFGLCKQKIEHIYRYLENHFNVPQDNLGLVSESSGCTANSNTKPSPPNLSRRPPASLPQTEFVDVTAEEGTSQERKGKHTQFKTLRRPRTVATSGREHVLAEHQHDEGVQKPAQLCTIRVLPQSLKDDRRQQQKGLGIFNKGKAVASAISRTG